MLIAKGFIKRMLTDVGIHQQTANDFVYLMSIIIAFNQTKLKYSLLEGLLKHHF
jgi:hypothetical protein